MVLKIGLAEITEESSAKTKNEIPSENQIFLKTSDNIFSGAYF